MTGRLAEFLKFINDARSFLKRGKVSKHHPEVKAIRNEVEEEYHDDSGKPAIFQKFESTLYEDAPTIVALWVFFQSYNYDQLCTYYKLTLTEIDGLKGDYHPMAIFGRSVFGTGALVLSGITVWWGLIKLVTIDETGNWLAELIRSLISSDMENRVVGMILLVGMFVVIWYPIRMVRNRKQVAFLSSLSRALALYIDDIDSRGR